MDVNKILAALRREREQVEEAIRARQVSIRYAHPPDLRKGMLPISHMEHFARIAELIADDAIQADLCRQRDLLEMAIASVERLRHPRRPPRTQRAGASIRVEVNLADAVATPKDTRVER